MSDDVRPVWLDKAQRNAVLQASGFCAQMEGLAGVLRDVVAAYDAAPADLVRIAAKAIHDAQTSSTLNRDAERLLRALGMPS